MTVRVRFYFDFISPYAYLGWSDAKALAAQTDTGVSFEPVLLAALLDHWGQLGPAEIGPERLVFGVPTFLGERDGEEELFSGHDRFGDRERWIAGDDPAAAIGADLERPASADRRGE